MIAVKFPMILGAACTLSFISACSSPISSPYSDPVYAGLPERVTEAQLAGFLVALRAKGETVDEIVGFRDAALAHAREVSIPPMVLDIVGTGGDPYGAVVNVSSIASIVAAATGVPGSPSMQWMSSVPSSSRP